MSAPKKRLMVSPTCSVAGSFCIRKKKELLVLPILPWHIPLHGYCVNTHYPSDPSRDKPLPHRLFTQTLEEDNARHCETPFHQSLGPRPLTRIFHPCKALSNATSEFLRSSSQSADLVSFLLLMLSSRVGSWYSSPWASCGFLTPQPCSFLCKPRDPGKLLQFGHK